MLKYVVIPCRIHIGDMFDKISIMAIRGPFMSMIKCLHLYLCSIIIYNLWMFHEGMGSGLSPSP